MKPTTRSYETGRTSGEINRANEMRRDNDVVKVPKITLYDIDYAIYYHLNDSLKPRIEENGASIPVPVLYSNGEKWAQIRAYGFMRDNNQKVMAPAILIQRNSVSSDERFPMVDLNNYNSTYRMLPFKTMNMKYDRVSGQYQRSQSYEYYMVDVPEYIRLSYTLIIWTDLQEQMNGLVHTIMSTDGHNWGDYNRFRSVIQDTTHDNVNVPGEDRLVKTTMTLQVDGRIRSEYEYHRSKIQKQYSVKTVKFLSESTEQIISDDFNTIDEIGTGNIADGIDSQPGNLKRRIRL